MKGRADGARRVDTEVNVDVTARADMASGAGTSGAADLVMSAADALDSADECTFSGALTAEGGQDPIDELIADWRRERPDLDASALGCFARMKLLSKNLAGAADQVLRHHGLNPGEFDVLATLRRSGPPCTLIPSQLSSLLMMSRAGMTNRLDRLEASGLIERSLDPTDRRSFRVCLTAKGRAVVDAAITEHAELVNRMDRVLSSEQRQHLDDALRALLAAFQ
jgi:DNA-binding MarR family transcriptional regulator